MWNRNVVLYNKRALSKANKQGKTIAGWLAENPIEPVDCELYIQAVKANKIKIIKNFKNVQLVPPEITSIECWDGSDASSGLHKDSIVILKGNYFGIKNPNVCLEYTDEKGAIKLQRLKVLRGYKYANAKGQAKKSCMDCATSASQIQVEMPKTSWTPGNYFLVLKNKAGIALDTGTGTLPIIKFIKESENTAPVANDDSETLQSGVRKYIFDVLANDTDAEGDRLILTLDKKITNEGALIAVKNGKINYALPKEMIATVDTFKYIIDDGHGKIDTATVTVLFQADN